MKMVGFKYFMFMPCFSLQQEFKHPDLICCKIITSTLGISTNVDMVDIIIEIIVKQCAS